MKNPFRNERMLILTFLSRVVRPGALHCLPAEENCLTANAASRRDRKVVISPCIAKAAIPCGLAVRKFVYGKEIQPMIATIG